MLVLSRRINEVIIIDPLGLNIQVHVIEILRGKVRIGIDAPEHVEVNREEVELRIARNGERGRGE